MLDLGCSPGAWMQVCSLHGGGGQGDAGLQVGQQTVRGGVMQACSFIHFRGGDAGGDAGKRDSLRGDSLHVRS